MTELHSYFCWKHGSYKASTNHKVCPKCQVEGEVSAEEMIAQMERETKA